MRTTGIFTAHKYVIKFHKVGDVHRLFPFGDVHKSSTLHSKAHWKAFIDYGKIAENAHFIGMGDYNDLGSTTERKLLNSRELHESTVDTLSELYNYQVSEFYKDVEFMKGRVVGILNGNHYGEYPSGLTTDHKLADMLNCRFLGVASLIQIQFVRDVENADGIKQKPFASVVLFAHHGRGGGSTVGGSMNPVQRMQLAAEADIYLMGDNHQKSVAFDSRVRLGMGNGSIKVRDRKILLARTGSFLKAYEDDKPSYVADMCLKPADLGVIKITLTPKSEGDYDYIDIHASV